MTSETHRAQEPLKQCWRKWIRSAMCLYQTLFICLYLLCLLELFQADVDEFCQYYGRRDASLCFPDFQRKQLQGQDSNFLEDEKRFVTLRLLFGDARHNIFILRNELWPVLQCVSANLTSPLHLYSWVKIHDVQLCFFNVFIETCSGFTGPFWHGPNPQTEMLCHLLSNPKVCPDCICSALLA